MSRPTLPATETEQDGLLTESPTEGLSEEEEKTVDATNGFAAIPQEPDSNEEEDDTVYSDEDATDTEGEDDEEEDEEPALKYERLGGAVPDLLQKDSASALAIANKVIASFISNFPTLFMLTRDDRHWGLMVVSCIFSI
jgi:hypothetical protein